MISKKMKLIDILHDVIKESIIKSDILIENVDKIYNKYYQDDFERELFNTIVSYDPTTIQNGDKIKKMGKYSKWLLKLSKDKKIKEEDLYKATTYLDILNKKTVMIKRDGGTADINKYNSLPQLFNVVKPYMSASDERLNKDDIDQLEDDFLKSGDAEKVFENATWKVIVPHTHKASCFFGSNTQWCTANDSDSYYNTYSSHGKLYININKKTGEKYQFHFEDQQYMDSDDDPIDISEFFDEYMDLYEFYQPDDYELLMKISDNNLGYRQLDNPFVVPTTHIDRIIASLNKSVDEIDDIDLDSMFSDIKDDVKTKIENNNNNTSDDVEYEEIPDQITVDGHRFDIDIDYVNDMQWDNDIGDYKLVIYQQLIDVTYMDDDQLNDIQYYDGYDNKPEWLTDDMFAVINSLTTRVHYNDETYYMA